MDIETESDGRSQPFTSENVVIMEPSTSQRDIITAFLTSGEPQTTQNYRLNEFIGPVSIKKFRDKRGVTHRGLYISRPASRGQILLISNTFAACTYTGYYNQRARDEPSDRKKERIPHEAHQQLAAELSKAITTSRKAIQIFNLDYKPITHLDDQSVPHVDLYRDLYEPSETSSRKLISSQRCWEVVARNAWKDDTNTKREDVRGENSEFWGIWLLPSFINHSCIPNCSRLRIGKTMIVHAARDIVAGEKLNLPYFDIFMPLRLREASAKLWDFRCECPRCMFERTLGVVTRSIARSRRRLNILWNDKRIPPTVLADEIQLGKLESPLKQAIKNHYAVKKMKRHALLPVIERFSTMKNVLTGQGSNIPEIAKAMDDLNIECRKPEDSDDDYAEMISQKLGLNWQYHNRVSEN